MTWPSKSAFNFRISARFDFPIDFHSSPPFPPTFSNANFARNLLPLTAVRKGERENLFLFLDSQFSHFYLCLLLLCRLCRRIQARMSAANATATADIPIVLETWKDIARTRKRQGYGLQTERATASVSVSQNANDILLFTYCIHLAWSNRPTLSLTVPFSLQRKKWNTT